MDFKEACISIIILEVQLWLLGAASVPAAPLNQLGRVDGDVLQWIRQLAEQELVKAHQDQVIGDQSDFGDDDFEGGGGDGNLQPGVGGS